MKAAGSLFAIENKDVEAHTRTSFWEKESLATTVNAAKTTMHKNIAFNHFITKTRTRFYRIIRQKTRTNIEIDNNPPYHDENFPHQSRVGLRLYQNPSPNSKANRKLSVEPNQEYLVVNLFKKVSQIPPP